MITHLLFAYLAILIPEFARGRAHTVTARAGDAGQLRRWSLGHGMTRFALMTFVLARKTTAMTGNGNIELIAGAEV